MAVRVVRASVTLSTCIVETTLSLARKPEINAVTMRQSPRPSGAKTGATSPAICASMLSSPSTIRRRKSNDWRNQMTMDATKITVKALCRKSLVLSQSSMATFLAPGIR